MGTRSSRSTSNLLSRGSSKVVKMQTAHFCVLFLALATVCQAQIQTLTDAGLTEAQQDACAQLVLDTLGSDVSQMFCENACRASASYFFGPAGGLGGMLFCPELCVRARAMAAEQGSNAYNNYGKK